MSKFANERAEPGDLHGFEDVLDAARVDCLSPEEMDNYQYMLDAVKNEIRSAHQYDIRQAEARGRAEGKAEGRVEGRAEGKVEMAKALRTLGIPDDKIAQASGLSLEEVAAL